MANPSDINKILQILKRDQYDATYKFALLRGMLDVIDKDSYELAPVDVEKGIYPLGLLVKWWIYYYFPLIQADIPQKHGELPGGEGSQIAFRPLLKKAIARFQGEEGYTAFHHEFQRGRIVGQAAGEFKAAADKIADTITKMPMLHLGFSANGRDYSVVRPISKPIRNQVCDCFDNEFLRNSYGSYQISEAYLAPLKQLGAIIIGTESILYQWAEFTAGIKNSGVKTEKVLSLISTPPSDERDVKDAREHFLALLDKGEVLPCIWCGKPVTKDNLAVDHVIPFSLWGDNSLPNLMPCHSAENSRKSDKIPTPEKLDEVKERMLHYLKAIPTYGHSNEPGVWEEGLGDGRYLTLFYAMRNKCKSLIDDRGYSEWNG